MTFGAMKRRQVLTGGGYCYQAFSPKISPWTIEMIAKEYPSFGLCPETQRMGGVQNGSGWSMDNSVDYMTSMFAGCTGNRIILVDLKKVLLWVDDLSDDVLDPIEKAFTKAYCLRWIGYGKKHIILDGHNTASTIYYYVKGTVKAQEADSYGHDSLVSFTELSDLEQMRKLTQFGCQVVTLEEISRNELGEVFKRLNRNTQLERHELRQPIKTLLADLIRLQANKNNNPLPIRGGYFWKQVFSAQNIDKRYHEEELASYAFRLQHKGTQDVNHDNLDEFYATVYALRPKDVKRLKKVQATADRIGKAMADWTEETGLKQPRKLDKGAARIVLTVLDQITDLGYDLVKGQELQFLAWVLKTHTTWQSESKKEKFDDEEQKLLAYFKWTKNFQRQLYYNRVVYLWRTKLSLAIKHELIADAANTDRMLKEVRTPKDRFSQKTKLALAVLQDWTLRDGMPIDPVKLYLGGYDGGHLKSFFNGGTVDVTNAEIQEQSQRGGNNTEDLQEHFDFQKITEEETEVEEGAA